MNKYVLLLASFMIFGGAGYSQCTILGTPSLKNPTSCGAWNGSITMAGLDGTVSLYTVTYKKNNVLTVAELSSSAVGLSIINLGKGSYTDISIGYNNGACSTFLSGPYLLTDGAPLVGILPASDTICPGNSVILNAWGGITYWWYPSAGLNMTTGNTVIATPSETTTYHVIGYTGPCSNTDSVTIIVTANLTVNEIGDRISCHGTMVPAIVFSGTPGAGFQWTNTNKGIGLDSAGIGDIPSFNATNTDAGPVTGVITVTPVNTDNGNAYIPRSLSNDVIIFNTETNTIAGSLSVGQSPSGVAVSPSAHKVYVANRNGNSVSVISQSTNSVTATIPVGLSPASLAVSPDGTKVYVTNQNGNSVSVINTATNTIASTVAVGQAPGGIAVSPGGNKLYVVNNGSDNISVIDPVTNLVNTTIPVGSAPTGVAFSPDGAKAYVANNNSHTVSIINTVSNTVIGTVTVGTNPFGIAISPNGTKVYVSNTLSGNVSVIETSTASVKGNIPVGTAPQGISITPDGSSLWVVTATGLSIINTETNTVTGISLDGVSPALGNFIDGGSCIGPAKTFSIIVNPAPSALIFYAGNPFCNAPGNAVVSFNGTGGGNFSSSAGLSLNNTNGTIDLGLSQAGTYTVTYTIGALGGCASYSTNTSVTINPVPPQPLITQAGNTLQSSAPAGNQWYLNGTAIAGATAQNFIPVQSGDYTVRATVNGCQGPFSAVFNYIVTSVDSIVWEKYFHIAPNPVQGILQIRYKGTNGRFRFRLFDSGGRQVLPEAKFQSECFVNMQELANGIYIIELINERSGERIQKQVFKMN